MDHIAAYVDGRNVPNLGSGFAVILLSTNDRWERSLAYGMHTVNAADLLGVKFALLSIAKPFDKLPVKIYIKNQYVIDMMKSTNGVYDLVPKANYELVDEIRAIIDTKKVEFIIDSDHELSKKCHELSIKAIKNNELVNFRK